MAAVVATPVVVLADTTSDTRQMTALVALFAGFLTFVEYNAQAPSVIEFRDAPPFNRMRTVMLFTTLLCLAMVERDRTDPTTLTSFLHAIAHLIGISLDFPYSPIRLALLMLDPRATPEQVGALRDAAGMSFAVAFFCVVHFCMMLRVGGWPRRGRAFNVWINLPTFDPTASADVVVRLERDAWVNICLGILLPFLIPLAMTLGFTGLDPSNFTAPYTLIWIMTVWSFLPAGLLMRGIAMSRIAEMIRQIRHARSAGGAEALEQSSRAF